MGLSCFSRCKLEYRFCTGMRYPFGNGGHQWLLYDWDQRRVIDVLVPGPDDVQETFVLEAVVKFIDHLPSDVVQVTLSKGGNLVSSSSDLTLDRSWAPFYPARTDFPRRVLTTRRRDLTELERLGVGVDLTPAPDSSHSGGTRVVAFKYYLTENDVANSRHETNCVLRLRHPNIVPFDSLVVDRIENVDRVVGFTTRYIPGGTLSENKSRVFKLKYLRELISVGNPPASLLGHFDNLE